MLQVLKASVFTGYTAEQIRLSSISCDHGKNAVFNWTISCGWPNQKLYYQLISWECSSEDSSLVIWRKSMRALFSKSCVCLTEDWGKMALGSPDRNHSRNDPPKATKEERLWVWDPHQGSCCAEPGCQSPRIKNIQADCFKRGVSAVVFQPGNKQIPPHGFSCSLQTQLFVMRLVHVLFVFSHSI